ncbi:MULTISPECIES: SpoIIE family protein phosphatase [unclassified Streptomyces]|uniref:GAF domain-containing SpoIIE family protein phosphatase n=1 Tax=unclassified Streptomyces TaxID=2593676 RepID=UPI002ED17D8F|nr:SpoIIE family protein phosphatase [Streptomyces sp. NBC_00891]WSY06450.1 SpoIIE family protein phosphatase [Streptomyces sp. NBC_00890]WSZ08074.1 SpoIIE family protein phosphatase [Streptomyces sp. NBC_00869]WSZ24426.1 SpoIIE family protein phosphatase [Streptomyces sp. NBC_00870]
MKDPGRLEALRLAGLTAAADPGMDRFARLVTRLLRVPVSLVSLLEADRQVFPGMVGMSGFWAARRETPLTHSFCQHVVADGKPLTLSDARMHPRTCASLAIPDLQVIAYAGMPLTDADGHVLGSLCAIDHQPRTWTADELHDLEDLTAACSMELRLRIASELIQRDRDHAGLLLRAAIELAHAHDLTDLTRRLRHLFQGPSEPTFVGLLLADGGKLWRVIDPEDVRPVETAIDHLERDAAFPSALAMREQRTVFVPDRTGLLRGFGPEAVAGYDSLGLESVLCVPLPNRRGVLTWCWSRPHVLAPTEEAVLTTVAGYVSQAVERTRFVANRLSTAEQLQAAMLTELPDVPGLDMAALYLPAADQDMVGGDWYDAYPLPTAPPATRPALMLSIGDVIGHDVQAATVMGQIRSMLRQASLDDPAHSPATALNAIDRAIDTLPLGLGATAVHARLDLDDGHRRLTWSNAGHPPPLLRTPDGGVSILDDHDLILLGTSDDPPRHDHTRDLPPGSVLLLYTDGLVERRDADIDAGTAHTAAVLARHADKPLPLLLEALAKGLAEIPHRDDVAVLVVRVAREAG